MCNPPTGEASTAQLAIPACDDPSARTADLIEDLRSTRRTPRLLSDSGGGVSSNSNIFEKEFELSSKISPTFPINS